MAPAFGAIALTVVMAYPVNVFPCRYAVELALNSALQHAGGGGWWGGISARTRHLAITVGLACASLAVALVVPDISLVFSLLGGTCSAYVCFILPAAFCWRLAPTIPEAQGAAGRAACAALFAFGLLIGVLSTSTTIASLFDGNAPYDSCNRSTLSAAAH
eukprot:6232942-Prymnesium_polylepis.1